MSAAGKSATNPDSAYRQKAEEVLAALATDGKAGLSDGEARTRLERYGRNELQLERGVPPWKKFLAQFKDVIRSHQKQRQSKRDHCE